MSKRPDRAAHAATPQRGAARLPDRAAFWGAGVTMGLFLFAAAAPSPLYGRYAALWRFSPLTLTIVFALYAVALLAALLITGRLSDHLGRRPVILAAVGVEIAAMACFISADSTIILGVARVMQGLATGAALGAIAAALVELSAGLSPGLAPMVNAAAPTFGLAAGGLGSSALVQYGPAPLRLVYWVIVAGLILAAIATWASRETATRRPGALASLRPRVGVPSHARTAFAKVVPCLVALWALSGFYLALGPGLTSTIVGSPNLLWGGALIFALCASGGVAVLAARGISAHASMLMGCAALLVGVGLTFVAIATTGPVLLFVGSVIAGVGFGLSFLGAFRALSALAAPAERAGTIAAIYVVSYLAFSIPIVAAGVAITRYGAHDVALVFAASVAVLAAFGVAAGLPRRRHLAPPACLPEPCVH